MCYVKKVFLKISQNSQENTCARACATVQLQLYLCNSWRIVWVCLTILPGTLLKKRLWHRFFPVNFAKFLRTPFLQNTFGDCFCQCHEMSWFTFFCTLEYQIVVLPPSTVFLFFESYTKYQLFLKVNCFRIP